MALARNLLLLYGIRRNFPLRARLSVEWYLRLQTNTVSSSLQCTCTTWNRASSTSCNTCNPVFGFRKQLLVLQDARLFRTSVNRVLAVTAFKKPKKRGPVPETEQYLSSLGLDCDLIQTSKPTVLQEQLSKVKGHVSFLRSLDFDDDEILSILKRAPELLKVDPFGIHQHIKFLQHLELDNLLIVNILQRVPKFFATPLSTIKANVRYVESLNLTDKNVHLLMKYSPSLFYRRRNGLQNIGDCLRKILLKHNPQIAPDVALKYMLRSDPLLFGRSIGEIEQRVEHLINLGFTGVPLANIIRFCPSAVRISSEYVTERLQMLQKILSLSYEEAVNIVIRLPKLLHASNEALDSKINFLFQRGFKDRDIFKAPRVLMSSVVRLEQRLDQLDELNYRVKTFSVLQFTEEDFQEFVEKVKNKMKQCQKENEQKE